MRIRRWAAMAMSALIACLCMTNETGAAPLFTEDTTALELSETAFVQPYIRRQNGLEVKAERMYLKSEENSDYLAIDIRIDNRTGQALTLAVTGIFVNDCNVTERTLTASAPGGQTAWFTLGLPQKPFEEFGIEHILWMDLDTEVYGGDGDEIVYGEQRSRLETSRLGSYEQSYEFPGQMIYDSAEARISMKNALRESSNGKSATVFLSNRTDADMEAELTLTQINEVPNVELSTVLEVEAGSHSGAYVPFPVAMQALFIKGEVRSAKVNLRITAADGRLIGSAEGIPISFQ